MDCIWPILVFQTTDCRQTWKANNITCISILAFAPVDCTISNYGLHFANWSISYYRLPSDLKSQQYNLRQNCPSTIACQFHVSWFNLWRPCDMHSKLITFICPLKCFRLKYYIMAVHWGFYVKGTCYNLTCNNRFLNPPCATSVLNFLKTLPLSRGWFEKCFQKFIHLGWGWLPLCKDHMETRKICLHLKSQYLWYKSSHLNI